MARETRLKLTVPIGGPPKSILLPRSGNRKGRCWRWGTAVVVVVQQQQQQQQRGPGKGVQDDADADADATPDADGEGRCGCGLWIVDVGARRSVQAVARVSKGGKEPRTGTLTRSQLHATHRHTHIYTHQWTLASAMGVCVVEVDVRG